MRRNGEKLSSDWKVLIIQQDDKILQDFSPMNANAALPCLPHGYDSYLLCTMLRDIVQCWSPFLANRNSSGGCVWCLHGILYVQNLISSVFTTKTTLVYCSTMIYIYMHICISTINLAHWYPFCEGLALDKLRLYR